MSYKMKRRPGYQVERPRPIAPKSLQPRKPPSSLEGIKLKVKAKEPYESGESAEQQQQDENQEESEAE